MSENSKCYWDIADSTTSCGYFFTTRIANNCCPFCFKPIHIWNSDLDYTEHQVTRSIQSVQTDAQSGERE